MTDVDLSSYKSLYLNTAREHLRDLRKNLSALNSDSHDKNSIYEIFRLFHSLKSQNYFMGFQQTGDYCKKLETYFRSIKDGNSLYQNEKSAFISAAIDTVEKTLLTIETTNREPDLRSESDSLVTNLNLANSQ